MADNKPQITATIKFRGVTIEGMSVDELRQLRDVLNELVGEKVVEKHIHHDYPHGLHPWYQPNTIWAVSGNTAADNKLTLGNAMGGTHMDGNQAQHYTISCN